ncbi:MAG: DUF2147 domain-containing protein [Pseudomonadota bacterium]
MKPSLSVTLGLALFVLSAQLSADQAPANTPVGYWKTIDDKTGKPRSIVKIFELNGELHGRIEKLLDQPSGAKAPTCDKCPGDKQGKPVLGLEFLWGFKRDGAAWGEGAVLDPEEGKVYHANLDVLDGGKRLKLFGFVRVVFKIGRSQTWTRVESAN